MQGRKEKRREEEEEEEERLKYSQNEDDDTSSRYQQSPWDDGSQFNLSGSRTDGRTDGRTAVQIYDPQGRESRKKTKAPGRNSKKEEVKLRGLSAGNEVSARPLQIQSLAASVFSFILPSISLFYLTEAAEELLD